MQLSLDGITVPRDYKGADKLRENRKKFHGNIEVTLNEAESTLKLGKRWMEALKQFSQQYIRIYAFYHMWKYEVEVRKSRCEVIMRRQDEPNM